LPPWGDGEARAGAWGCLPAPPPDDGATLPHQAGSRPKLLVRPALAVGAEDLAAPDAVRFFFLGVAASGFGSAFLLALPGALAEAGSDSSAAPPTSEEKYLEAVRLLPRPLIFSISPTGPKGVPPVDGLCDPAVGSNLGSAQRGHGAFSDEEGRVVEDVTRRKAQLVLLDSIPHSLPRQSQVPESAGPS